MKCRRPWAINRNNTVIIIGLPIDLSHQFDLLKCFKGSVTMVSAQVGGAFPKNR